MEIDSAVEQPPPQQPITSATATDGVNQTQSPSGSMGKEESDGVKTVSLLSAARFDDEEEEEDVCRICRNPGDAENPLRYPCACSGSIKFVHQDCLLQWLNHSNARQCEVCKHPFSFSPVYAENAPARLPFQEFVVGMTMKTCHVLQFFLRLSFVLSVWLLIIPFITFWIWRLAFVRSLGEAQRLFLSHISTTVILTDCLHGFLLSASIVFIFLGATSLRDYFRHLRELGGHDAEREDEGDRNGARAARRPPGQANRNVAGEVNAEDAGGAQGIAGAGQIIRRNAENVAARWEMQAARLEAHVEQMFDGLDDADGAEDVPFDELVGMQGPVFHLVENAFTVLASNMIFLGVVIFVPFSLGRIILYYISWLFSSASVPVLSTVMPLTDTALSLANITLKNALTAVANLTSEGEDGGVLGQVADMLNVNASGLNEVSNNISSPLSADLLKGASVGTSRLSDVTTLAIGYMFIFSLVVFYLGGVALIRYTKGEPLTMGRFYGIASIAETIPSLFRQFLAATRHLMTMIKVAFLLVIELGVFPLMCGWWLDICTIRMFGKSMAHRVQFFSISPLASSLVHWVVGIVYMLQISIFVSLLRGVLRHGVLYFLRDPADPNYNPFRDLIDDPVHKHARRVLLSVAVYGSLIVMLVFLPVKLAMRMAPSIFPLDISVSDPFTEIPADMLLFQICIPFAIEHFKLRTTIKSNSPFRESSNGAFAKSVPFSSPSPENSWSSQTQRKPPKIPTPNENLTRRRSLARSVYSKPKSRFGEQPYPTDSTVLEENVSTLQEQIGTASPHRNLLTRGSPNNKSASSVITPKTPLMASPGGPADEEDEEEVWKRVESSKQMKRRRVGAKAVIEWVAFLCILGCLIASLTVEKLEKTTIWSLEFWKWCVLVMVIFSGMLVTNWVMHVIVFLIERNFLLKKKVLYFVHGLKKSVQVFIWIALILLAWAFLFNHGVERSKTATKILRCITVTLMSLLIGSFLWLLKTLSLKILATNFHVSNFFDRTQESIFHQYVLQTLSGPPLIEEAERVGRSPSMGQLSFRSTKKGKATKEKKVIDMAKVHKMKQGKVSAWTMKVLVDAVTSSGLSTISNTLDESFADREVEQSDKEITNEMEATAAAYYIFRNVAQPGCKYIDEEDLLRFMIKEEVDLVFPLFEGYETGRVDRKALTDWVVRVYNGRKALAHSLNDTKTAVKQLHKLVTGILIVLTIIIWLLMMEIATTKVLVFLSSQLVAAAFMFGSTCKTIFEAIIFVFVMHPFDVGDRCVVDGIPMLVEEMNILNTVFLKLDNEKIYYPNSVLATKPISNYFRSPDMGDSVEFAIDFATPVEKIGFLKDKIKKHLEKTSHHWHPNHNVVVKEIENVNKLKMALYCTHTMNFQEYGEKNKRKSELVIEIKKIFEELHIKYYLLPQQVHLNPIGSESTNVTSK